MFYWDLFYFFFSPQDFRTPSADCHEIVHHDGKCVRFYNPDPKFWRALSKTILGAKNMQNLA